MKIKSIIKILFFLGIFFIPFNSTEISTLLGEYRYESAIFFLLLAFAFIIIYYYLSQKIIFPYKNKIYSIILLFIFWCLISFIFNFFEIKDFYYKQTSGIERFIKQYISILLACVICFNVYWFALRDKTPKEILFLIRKIFSFSLLFVSFYGLIELLIAYFNLTFLMPVFELFNYLPFIETHIHNGGRISSVSQEPPFLAIYLITIASWMFSYILTSKSKYRFIPTIVVLLLTFFSGSRAALAVVGIQTVFFTYYLYFHFGYKLLIIKCIKYISIISIAFMVILGAKFYDAISEKISSLNLLGNLETSISNKTRLGMQYTSLLVFSENPITGVGFGQQAFVAKDKYPTWATKNNYEFEMFYLNQNVKSFPPSFNLYTRLLAELGIIGFLIFVYFEIKVILTLRLLIKNETDFYRKTLGITLLISFAGLFINWLQIDSFRVYGVWLFLAILLIYMKFYEQNNSINSTLQQ